ncbi:MAG: hypothetical protein ABI959_10410 [Candidatus Dormiibacterota bacterium]
MAGRPKTRVIGLLAAVALAAILLVGIVWFTTGFDYTRLLSGRSPASPSPDLPSVTLPIRAAFYYPWFPEAWKQQGLDPFTRYHPSLGYYATDPATVRVHIRAMQYANIRAGIASWWGQGSATDDRIPMLLQAANVTGFEWALYYEPESQGDPPAPQIAADLEYIRSHYSHQPGYLRVEGRPVLFVYADGADGCGMSARWKQANTLGFYVALKVFPGFRACASQPDGWHQYAPAGAADSQPGFSFTISPAFWKATERAPRLARDPSRWAKSVAAMVASKAPWQLVTTFNEWGEGTSIESAVEWQSASGYGSYVDVLHDVT